MTIAGRPLELALIRGARHYRAAGRRCVLIRQHHEAERTSAPVDVIGGVDGVPWGLEAKMTAGDSFPLKVERAAQRDALQLMHDNGFTVGLVIEFTGYGEVYMCPWAEVAAFEAAPWRRSLTVYWCRAHGLLVPELDRGSEHKRATLFLDGKPHPHRAEMLAMVEAERAAATPLTLDAQLAKDDARDRAWAERRAKKSAESETLAQLMARKPAPEDHAAYIRWLDEFSRRELEANCKRARKLQRGRAGAWKGGRG